MMPRLLLSAYGLMVLLSAQGQMVLDSRWPKSAALSEWADLAGEEDALNVAQTYTEANRLIIERNWSEAAELMATLSKNDPENRNFAYKWALCLRAIPGRLEEAVPLVHLAMDGPFTNRYNAFDIREETPPVEALELGLEVLQHAYHFAEAQAVAERMLEQFSRRDFRYERALEAMAECDFAMECVKDPIPMEINPVRALNSDRADYAPVVTPDGNTLYFTSYRDGGRADEELGQIYRSMKTDNGWSRPVRLDIGMPGRDVTTVGIVGDDEALLAYQGYRKEGAVWKLTRDEYGGWSNEEKLGFPIDSRHWETSMTERFDGWERIFVSNRPGGQGGRDLYRTVKLPDGTWSEPLNLGTRINSAGEEESPVLSADGQTLIFASSGHPGMGGFDLFRCKRLDNGSWSDPEHLGHPLNTPGNEAVMTLDASGSAGYISSARAGGDDINIYRVQFLDSPGEELAVLIGEALAWQNGDVMEVRSLDEGEAIFRVFRARKGSGKFLAALPPCREYKFSWVRNGNTLSERKETVGCEAAYGVGQEVLRLMPFELGTEIEEPAPEAPTLVETEELVVEAPEVVETPEVVEVAEVTEAPEVVEVAEVTEAPEVVEVAEVTEAPEVAETPEVVEVPEATEAAAPAEESAPTSAEAVSTATSAPDAPVVMLEFEALTERIEFGYGKYMTPTGSKEVQNMAVSIAERNEAGDVPVLQIEGSASFVPVKNKKAYASNEQLAKMRAEKARDVAIMELAKRGLQVGVDYQIVLEWGVAGPEYKGDAVEAVTHYRNFQYAKFSLSRTLVEKRG